MRKSELQTEAKPQDTDDNQVNDILFSTNISLEVYQLLMTVIIIFRSDTDYSRFYYHV